LSVILADVKKAR